MNAQLIEKLNVALSNVQVLYVKLHNYHWNIKGPKFFELHKATEGYYENLAELYDEVAERVLQIEGTPFSTMKEYLDHAEIKEVAAKDWSAQEVLDGVVADFKVLHKNFSEIASMGDEAGDNVTVDLANDTLAELEKSLWMLKALAA